MSYMKLAIVLAISTIATACGGHFPRGVSGNSTSSTATIATRIKPAVPTARFAIIDVRVFDGYKVQPPSTVFVDGDVISKELDTVDYVVEGNGGILMPGFMDAHNHADQIEHLETLTSWGVTTSFVMNCLDYEVCSSLRDQTGLTSLFFAGYSAKGFNSSHAIAGNAPLNSLIYGPQQAPSYVAQVFGNGSDYLKIVSEPNGPDQATQDALVLNAHNTGHKVMTHATFYQYYIMAIKSKSDGPQHLPVDGLLNSTTLAEMYMNKQFATPTLAVYYQELHNPQAAAALGVTDAPFNTTWPILLKNALAIKDAGISVLTGTDASPPYAGQSNPFGSTVHDEMYYLVEAGWTPAEALRASVLLPALSHGVADRGYIKPGLRADMVLLQPDANPIACINDTRKISRVWTGGLEYQGPLKLVDTA